MVHELVRKLKAGGVGIFLISRHARRVRPLGPPVGDEEQQTVGTYRTSEVTEDGAGHDHRGEEGDAGGAVSPGGPHCFAVASGGLAPLLPCIALRASRGHPPRAQPGAVGAGAPTPAAARSGGRGELFAFTGVFTPARGRPSQTTKRACGVPPCAARRPTYRPRRMPPRDGRRHGLAHKHQRAGCPGGRSTRMEVPADGDGPSGLSSPQEAGVWPARPAGEHRRGSWTRRSAFADSPRLWAGERSERSSFAEDQ